MEKRNKNRNEIVNPAITLGDYKKCDKRLCAKSEEESCGGWFCGNHTVNCGFNPDQ